jgi:hypothetical protein
MEGENIMLSTLSSHLVALFEVWHFNSVEIRQ